MERDANVHHWASALALGYRFGHVVARHMNTVREHGQGIRDRRLPDRADIRIDDRAALMGDHLRRGGIRLDAVGYRLGAYLPMRRGPEEVGP